MYHFTIQHTVAKVYTGTLMGETACVLCNILNTQIRKRTGYVILRIGRSMAHMPLNSADATIPVVVRTAAREGRYPIFAVLERNSEQITVRPMAVVRQVSTTATLTTILAQGPRICLP